VVDVLAVTQRDEGIHIEQEVHGKSAKSTRTCSDVTGAVPIGATVTTSPEVGFFARRERAFFTLSGVSTI